ncbi:Tubulin gamma chain [Parelaphostrongylus tenuis]|uniref:Tubulin gamma chain n=1 Tax=Parelaphostrongylus tenuis TaxID=148309 RepID=A0AAD5QUH8_PARTN|nr:Tubulin gamma chain [Parelaphostrongylus tenuis]
MKLFPLDQTACISCNSCFLSTDVIVPLFYSLEHPSCEHQLEKMSYSKGQLMCIHVGQCGNQIGQSFWKVLCDEHGIDGRGRMTCEESIHDYKDVFFYQADDNHYVPRAVLVDLEPRVINGIMTSESFSRLFNPDNIYMSTQGGGAGNNWASGYGQGSEVYEQILDIIEREAENSDQMDGFLFTHSVSGGTGSGMGSLILEKIRDKFPKKVIQTFSVFANHEDTSDVIVHPYNSVLSMERLIDFPDHVVVLDNAALNRLAAGKFETQQPTFEHINSLVTRIMSTSTAMFRFESHILTSIRSMCLSPMQPLHFIQAGFSPVVDPNQSFTRKTSVADVVRNLLKPSSMMVSTASMTRPTHCMLSAFLFLQGQVSSSDVNTVCLSGHHSVNAIRRAPWDFMNPLRILQAPSSPYVKPQYKVSGLMLNNNTSIAPLFERILQQFARLRAKNAFIDRFQKEEGFSVDMMDSSAERVQELINLYSQAEKPDFLG